MNPLNETEKTFSQILETLSETLSSWGKDHPLGTGILLAFSLLLFAGTLLSLPFAAAAIPEDYFVRRRPPRPYPYPHLPRPLAWAGVILKNLLGFILFLAGIAMLFLPGQGLLTILMGLILMDFPGKARLERRLISRPAILRGVNALRRRRGKGPLRLPEDLS